MPRRNRDNSGKFLLNTPTTSNSQPSLFFGEQPDIFEEPIGEEEEEEPIPIKPMVENQDDRGDKERIEGAFPTRETNG